MPDSPPVPGPALSAGRAPPDNLRGAMLLMVAMAIFTFEAAVIRWLSQDIATMQAVMFRAMGQFVVVFAWAAWRGMWPQLRSSRMWLHVGRGFASIVGWWAYYLTFQKLDVGLATLLTFASSLFVVVLARPVLGEKVRLASWVATLAGFVGIAIAADVISLRMDPYVVLGLVSAMLSAAIVLMTRALAQSESTVTIMAWIGIFVLPASILAAWPTWQPISPAIVLLLLATGTIGALGMVLMIEAYAIAEAGVLAPIPYIRIAMAMVLGLVVFDERPTAAMLVGSAIVITSALYAIRAGRR